MIAGSQSSDGGKQLADIVSILRINLPIHLKS
jgi:hypothetical protein